MLFKLFSLVRCARDMASKNIALTVEPIRKKSDDIFVPSEGSKDEVTA